MVSEYRKALSGELVLADRTDRPAAGLITHTKLHRPRQPRTSCTGRTCWPSWRQGLQRPLTLISAAAGFGKTTLLAAWLESVGRRTPPVPGPGCSSTTRPATWWSLAATSWPPSRPSFPMSAANRWPCYRRRAGRRCLFWPGSLLNELDQIEEPFVLVLDDYHKIQDEHGARIGCHLIEHLPPQMHLAIASRTDPPFPLTSLRARGQVLEIRTSDLRFTPEETHTFLEGMVGRDLDRETTDLLGRKTEGWIVGLRLAALSMQGLPDVDAFVRRFEGTSSAYVADYLLDEVLTRQQPEVQEFLLRTCILDRFCTSLCDAVADGGPCARHRATTDDAAAVDRRRRRMAMPGRLAQGSCPWLVVRCQEAKRCWTS